MRKLVGICVILALMVCYIGGAAMIGGLLAEAFWLLQIAYFCVAGVVWVIPLRPVIRWMHVLPTPRPPRR